MLKKTSGFMLALVMIFLVVLMLLGAAIAALSYPEYFFINQHSATIAALHIADAGLKQAIYRLQSGNTTAFSGTLTPDLPSGSPVFGSYSVSMTADPGNSDDSPMMYYITVVGNLYVRPNITKTILAVAQSDSFAKFAYFTDQEISSPYNTSRIWFKTGDVLDGPVHSNDQISVYWGDYADNPPIFQSRVTTAEDVYYSPEDPNNDADYKEIFLNGAKGLNMHVSNVTFPPNTDAQKALCLGGITEPNANGIYLPTSGGELCGGIFIEGNVKQIRFSVDGNNNQVITITQSAVPSDRIATITIDRDDNVTEYDPVKGSTQTYHSMPKKIIYATSYIRDVAGTIKDRFILISNNNYSNNYVEISGDLVYWKDPRTHPTFTGALGIVAPNVYISDDAPSEINIDAAIMAADASGSQGSFYVENYDSMPVKGHINLYGSVVQSVRGPVGTFYSSTGTQASGYLKNYHFDNRFYNSPPPFFPTTTKFTVRFWKNIDTY